MTFEKELRDKEKWAYFLQETDDDGRLIRQHYEVKHIDLLADGEMEYNFYRLEKKHEHDKLYHVTTDERLKDVLQNGLVPRVGNCYANHWLAFYYDAEIHERLYPATFFIVGKPINKWPAKCGYPVLEINCSDLDQHCLFVDDAWKNEESLVYTKPIPLELITVYQFGKKSRPKHST